MPKLYFMRDFRKAKKLDLISGNELKSVVMSGKLELNIISTRVDKNSGFITACNFDKTKVNNATNYCYLVSGMQVSKSFKRVPNGKTKIFKIYSACCVFRSLHFYR